MTTTTDDVSAELAQLGRRLEQALEGLRLRAWTVDELAGPLAAAKPAIDVDIFGFLPDRLAEWAHTHRRPPLFALRTGRLLLRLLDFLAREPGEPADAPAPVAAGSVVDKVRALLAKAESTAFEPEADALVTKAHELMTRHSIEHSLVTGRTRDGAGIAVRRVCLRDPYVRARFSLLSAIADACGCTAVFGKATNIGTVVGHRDDLAAVDVLFPSLDAQAAAGIARSKVQLGSASATAAFRRSYLYGFASRIGARLEEGRASVVRAAEAELSVDVLPVLRDRAAQVDDAMRELFPKTGRLSTRVSNVSGWLAGESDANEASLVSQSRLPTMPRALGS